MSIMSLFAILLAILTPRRYRKKNFSQKRHCVWFHQKKRQIWFKTRQLARVSWRVMNCFSILKNICRSSVGSSIVTDDKGILATLNISELHHPKCASNMINNFGEIVVSSLEDESWKGLPTLKNVVKLILGRGWVWFSQHFRD